MSEEDLLPWWWVSDSEQCLHHPLPTAAKSPSGSPPHKHTQHSELCKKVHKPTQHKRKLPLKIFVLMRSKENEKAGNSCWEMNPELLT